MRKVFWTFVFATLIISFFKFGSALTSSPIPTPKTPFLIYKTEDDLRLTFDSAIQSANRSILVIIYSLRDPKIIHSLRTQAEKGISVTVICDPNGSQGIEKKLSPNIRLYKRQGKGLMHQKIVVIDDCRVWIGSANLTTQSLRMHENLVTGFYSPELAHTIENKATAMTKIGLKPSIAKQDFTIDGRSVQLWFLPDNPEAPEKIIQLINSANKTLEVAMFTWTRLDFAHAIIDAHERGVETTIRIDRNAAKGVGRKVTQLLEENGVPVHLSTGRGLLHSKMMLIDDAILVAGSANWTKAAFEINDECFLIIDLQNYP